MTLELHPEGERVRVHVRCTSCPWNRMEDELTRAELEEHVDQTGHTMFVSTSARKVRAILTPDGSEAIA